MRKYLFTFIALIMSSISVFAQYISFENGTWNQALQKAKETHQMIFVDVYTSWCAPCFKMANEVFTQPSVYDFFNTNFVNIKIDAEKGEGVAIAKTYGVTGFPTYLFVDENGLLVYQSVGYKPNELFIAEAQKAIHAHQLKALTYYTENYAEHKTDAKFLLQYLQKLKNLGHNYADVLYQYLTVNKSEEPNLEIFQQIFTNAEEIQISHPLIQYYLKNKAKFDVLDPHLGNYILNFTTQKTLATAIEEKNDKLFHQLIQFDKTYLKGKNEYAFSEKYYQKTNHKAKYYEYLILRANQVTSAGKAGIESANEEYVNQGIQRIKLEELDPEYQKEKIKGYIQYNNDHQFIRMLSALNEAASEVALRNNKVKNKAELNAALNWMKLVISILPDEFNHLDTYATIQYLLGNQKEAIEAQSKVVKMSKSTIKLHKEFKNKLSMMKMHKHLEF